MQTAAESKPISYAEFRHLPEQDRWQWYEHAKRERANMQAAGVVMLESYGQFVKRVTDELEI